MKNSEIKVLLVGPQLTGGGAEGRFANLAKYLFMGNSSVAVLSYEDTVSLQLERKVLNLGWKNRYSYFFAIWRLRRHLVLNRYDVVFFRWAFSSFCCGLF